MKLAGIFQKIYLIPLLVVWPALTVTFAQDVIESYDVEDTIVIFTDLFGEEDPVSITLVYNIKDFIRNKHKNEYHKARLIYHFNDTVDIDKEIRLKARGKNRQQICPFPPIWINIKKAKVKNKYLEDTKKIKMVTHCAQSKWWSKYPEGAVQ